MKVSILLATCHRPDLLKGMLDSLIQNTGRFDIEIVTVIDEDYKSRDVVNNSDFDSEIMDFYAPKKRGALWAWNRALQLSTGDILVPAGDDQIFYPNWLEYALESHQERLGGFGVVGMNDLAYDGDKQVATMLLFDRTYCKEVMGGVIAPPMLHYYCVDLWWNDKAKMLGRFFWDERSKIEHIHSAHGKRPIDDLDREKMDAGWMEEDNKIYAEQKSLGLPVTWDSLI